MSKVKIILEYDGTAYVGWQRQPNGRSIQEQVELALEKMFKCRVHASASGRTDAGVHALGQAVSFSPPFAVPLKACIFGLTALLPRDIAVVDAQEVPENFDARKSARGKRYRYVILNRPCRSPLRRLQRWEIFQPLNVDAMRLGARCLIGEHDFSAFRAANCEARSPVKTISAIEIQKQGFEISLEFTGSGFLKQMVRNIVGTLVEVGLGKRTPESVRTTLESLDRNTAGAPAPPPGGFPVEGFFDFSETSVLLKKNEENQGDPKMNRATERHSIEP